MPKITFETLFCEIANQKSHKKCVEVCRSVRCFDVGRKLLQFSALLPAAHASYLQALLFYDMLYIICRYNNINNSNINERKRSINSFSSSLLPPPPPPPEINRHNRAMIEA